MMSDASEMITLTIDGQQVTVAAGTTILEAARSVGIDVPVICYHEATTANGLCRVCVVDADGGRLLQPACIVPCRAGMVVETRNERVERSRRTILEMLNSAVNLAEALAIQALLDDYGAQPDRFPAAEKRDHALIDDNPFYVRDYSQCVLCWRCVQVCAEDAQYTYALTLDHRGFETHVSTGFGVPMPESSCVFCGQCISVCPTGALKPKIEFGLEQGWTLEQIWENTRFLKKNRRKSG